MSWFGGSKTNKRLAGLQEVLRRDIDRFIGIYTKHIQDNWFPTIGKSVEFPVPMPYYGVFSLERVSPPPDILNKATELMFFRLSLQKDDKDRCNFPRIEVIKLSKAIGERAGVEVYPDFSSLPGDYLGETSDINAFRRHPDLYGSDI